MYTGVPYVSFYCARSLIVISDGQSRTDNEMGNL